jgi:lysophospholipase L1-like esterase
MPTSNLESVAGNGKDGTESLRFLALGDSYTIGEGVAENDRWSVQLAARLRNDGIDIGEPTIIARTGWTTNELMAGIDRAKPGGVFHLVTLQIGVNNQYRGLSEDEFLKELQELLEFAVEFAGGDTSRVLVLSIPDWGVTPFAEGRDRAAIAAEIDRYNVLQRREAERLNCHFIDVTSPSRKAAHDHSLLTSDGLHPSAKMYEHWTTLVLPVARTILTRGNSH